MKITQHGMLKLVSGWPVVGNHFQAKLDKSLLIRLETIEARFSSATVRFATQVHDLYDCLKALQTPLMIEVGSFHSYAMVVHTKTSSDAQKLLERLTDGMFIKHDEYFKSSGIGRRDDFLNWFSNTNTFNAFVSGMTWLLHAYCSKVPRDLTEDGSPFSQKEVECNEITEQFMTSRWFRLLILDLIQSLIVVLAQRTGG